MPYLTLTENLKLQLSPGLVASYNIQPGNGQGLFWDKHTHVYLLTYLPRTHTKSLQSKLSQRHHSFISFAVSSQRSPTNTFHWH